MRNRILKQKTMRKKIIKAIARLLRVEVFFYQEVNVNKEYTYSPIIFRNRREITREDLKKRFGPDGNEDLIERIKYDIKRELMIQVLSSDLIEEKYKSCSEGFSGNDIYECELIVYKRD